MRAEGGLDLEHGQSRANLLGAEQSFANPADQWAEAHVALHTATLRQYAGGPALGSYLVRTKARGFTLATTQHSLHSSYREMVLEHLFVGEVMRYSWCHGLDHIEMLKSQVDNSGYDIVLEANGIMRHIQLKASHVGAATPGVGINTALARKPSGCVVWIFFEPETLRFTHFLWFGSAAGEPLASLDDYKVATHNKRNAQGVKTERVNIRKLPRSAFTRIDSVEDVVVKLFGNGRNGQLIDTPTSSPMAP